MGSDGQARCKTNVLLPSTIDLRISQGDKTELLEAREDLKVRGWDQLPCGPGANQVRTVSKDTESHLTGKLAPHQALPTEDVGQRGKQVRDFLTATSCTPFTDGEAEGPAGKSWGREGGGGLTRLTQAHKNSDERSDSSLFTNNSALLEFPKVILLEEY